MAAVSVPVTADIESGFGADPTAVGETIRQVVATGVNLEDGVRPAAEHAARPPAARAAAGGIPYPELNGLIRG